VEWRRRAGASGLTRAKAIAEALAETVELEDAKRARLAELRERLSAKGKDAFAALPREERIRMSAVVAKDAQVKPSRGKPSDVFLHGPAHAAPAVMLARLLADASKASGVPLPQGALSDLPKSGLIDEYAELLER